LTPTLFSRRDFLKLSSLAMLSGALPALRLPATAGPAPTVLYHGSRNLRTLAMTYDDCWHPEVLNQLIGMVEPYPGFHFTFFAVGDAMDIGEARQPGLWKRLIGSGHEIGYHTYHHVDPQVMSTSSLIADFDLWTNTLERVVGFRPPVHFARPPYDDLSLSFEEMCQARGMVATLYSAGFESTNMDDSMRLISRAQNGDIVQMHTYQDPPNGRFDVDITAKAVPYLAGQGFKLVTMSELYDGVILEQYSSDGCDAGAGSAPTRGCLE
jgi:peptidoglycan/xylan/chitin deacetylase (PgdA/CDA1 family)